MQRLLDGHQASLLEMLQWTYRFCFGRATQPGYNPVERRRASKGGGTSRVPTFGISNGAFKKWRCKGARRAGDAREVATASCAPCSHVSPHPNH